MADTMVVEGDTTTAGLSMRRPEDRNSLTAKTRKSQVVLPPATVRKFISVRLHEASRFCRQRARLRLDRVEPPIEPAFGL